jgi:membrane fusion protein, multidrug efflux system
VSPFRDVGTNSALAGSTRGVFAQTEGVQGGRRGDRSRSIGARRTHDARLKARWQQYGTPVLVVLLAVAIVVTMTRNWNAWEGGRIEQVTNDAFVRGDVTPLSTKVAGLVREVRVTITRGFRRDELVRLEDEDYRATVAQARLRFRGRERRARNNQRRRELQDSRIRRAEAGIDQANAQIAAAEAGKEATQADVTRTQAERTRQEALLQTKSTTQQCLAG